MTITADTATSTSRPVEVPPAADHTISIDTAADVLEVQPATIRRYVHAGRLARLAGGISADSVAAYIATREDNIAKTRFRPAAAYGPDGHIAAAAALYHRAAAMARQAEAWKKLAKATLDHVADGVYGGWEVARKPTTKTVKDGKAIEARFAQLGEDVPMKPVAPSLIVTRAA
ncbi:hypothetical protein [Frankia tisae]|uniref:hypothetical protein n=1 Tax=Frankia tisae TaxID=2950104 RepID=UPI0021C1DF61|nr:hypothetical protein [Frankia tisae]